MIVARADTPELPALVAVYDEAAQWLLERGIPQWQVGEHTLDGLALVDVFVAKDKGEIIGGFYFQTPDLALWPDSAQIEASYLAGLVIARSHAGAGRALLGHAERLATTPHLRLDCWAGSDALRRFYQEAGFTECGIVSERSWFVQRFEKRLVEGCA